MAKIGIFYGSTSGTTEEIAEKLQEEIGEDLCDLFNMEEDFDDVDDFNEFVATRWGMYEIRC